MLWRLLLTSALVAVFLVVAPRVAHAQVVMNIFQEQSLPRENAAGDRLEKRQLQFTPEGVSYQDCVDDIRVIVPLQMSGFVGNAQLQVWASLAGADCGQVIQRTGVARQCWPLVPGLPLIAQQNISLPVRTIMAGALNQVTPDPSAAICGQVDLTTVGVQFLYFDPGNTATPSATKTISVQVDTIGPAPPTGVRTKPGNGRISVEWNNISGEGGISVLTGIKVYCDKSGTTAIPTDNPACVALAKEREAVAAAATDGGSATAPGDASTTTTVSSPACTTVPIDAGPDGGDAGFEEICDDAGSSSSSSSGAPPSNATCSSTNIAPTDGSKITPSANFDGCFSCGSITGNTATSVVAEGVRGAILENNVVYTLAVASTDAFDNVGPLSEVICEYPEETNDFWANYRNAGGQAGGGCAVTGDAPLGSLAALGGACAVAFSLLRRRRSAK